MKFKSAILALGLACLATASFAGDFSYDASSHTILMEGAVYKNDGAVFASIVQKHPDAKTLRMSISVGGEDKAMMKMAHIVKSRHMATVSDGFCYSACAFIWLVGSSRSVIGENPQMHLPASHVSFKSYESLFYSHFNEMGLPKALADYIVSNVDGANNELVELTPSLLRHYGL